MVAQDASSSDEDCEPLCAEAGGDNEAVGIDILKPGTTSAVMFVFYCAFLVKK